MDNDFIDKINDFEKRSWAIKRYVAERWGLEVPCPMRLVVNPYHGCSIRCAYCYVWFDKKQAKNKPGFRKALMHDIERAKEFGINNLTVEVSSSTDPFQKLEEEAGDALFAIDQLLAGGFKVVIVTKNPKMLLDPRYIHLLDNKNVFIDVTITTLENKTISGKMIATEELSTDEKIITVTDIINHGKDVRVRIDPVIPTITGVVGQTKEAIDNLIKRMADGGAKLIISKTLRLNAGLPDTSLKVLIDYYKKNGKLVGENYILNKSLRRDLLNTIFESCQKYNIAFCPCCDYDSFSSEKTQVCHVAEESKQFE